MTATGHRLACAACTAIIVAAASGCASITGLDGTSKYACKAPDGVKCDSVSGTYHNAVQNNLPAQRRLSPSHGVPSVPGPGPQVAAMAAPTSARAASQPAAAPLRSAPKVVRLWIKPWEDADRDLNGESLVYVQTDNGRWLLDHVQRQAREPYAPVRLGTPGAATATQGGANGPPRPPGATGQNADSDSAIPPALRSLQNRATQQPGQ